MGIYDCYSVCHPEHSEGSKDNLQFAVIPNEMRDLNKSLRTTIAPQKKK